MSSSRRTAIFTTSRAEFGILSPLIQQIKSTKGFKLLLFVGRAHLHKKYGKTFYNMSFNEGMNTNTLEVTAKNKVEIIENSEYLINLFHDLNGKQFIYRLNFENKKALQEFKNSLDNSKDIEKINIVFN